MSRYDAGSGAASTLFNFEKLRRFINRILLDRDTLKTSFNATAFLDELYKKSSVKSGLFFESKVRRELSDTTKTFSPYDDATDFIGDSPYLGGASGTGTANTAVNTYTPKDAVRNMEVRWAFANDEIRFSQIYLTMLDSPGKFLDYFMENMDYIEDSMKVFIARQIQYGLGLGGIPTNANETNFYGLYNQVRSWAGDRTVTTVQNDPANTHFGLLRHENPSFVGNVWPADAVYDPASAGAEIRRLVAGSIVTSNITTLTYTNAGDGTQIDLASGRGTRLDLGAAATLPAHNVHDWYADVTINDATSDFNGQTFRFIVGHGLAGERYVGLSSQFVETNAVPIAANNVNCDVVIFPKFTLAGEGDAGVFTANKVHKAYFLDGAVDGSDFPDHIRVSAGRFYSFSQELQQLQRWYGEDPHLLSKGFHNFYFNAAHVAIDNYEREDVVNGSNTKYCQLKFLKGYNKYSISKSGLRYDTSGRRIDSIVGDVVVGGQVCDRSPNRSFRIEGLI